MNVCLMYPLIVITCKEVHWKGKITAARGTTWFFNCDEGMKLD